MSGYNSTTANFDEVTSNTWQPTNFGSETTFAEKVDISVPGVIMDCGECHVGGGGMEFVPASTYSARVPLRDITTADVNGFGPIADTMYTAFNYFIDTYDVDEDNDENEVMYMDYQNTGTMEMDCLLCHMPGYDYDKRIELLRDARIDATRPVPAGLATENTTTWADTSNTAPSGHGTLVEYDLSLFETYNVLGVDRLRLPEAWGHNNLIAKPDSDNCAFCHFNKPGVDWKKRGDNWAPDDQYDYTYEVHTSIGCMGCHERRPGTDYTSVYGGPYPTMGPGSLGHDPAKGSAPFSGLYNANDFADFKRCEDCHVNGADGGEYAAPNPENAHAAAGLSAKIVQATDSADGTPAISHIDLMDCAACHSRKIDSYNWGNTGNPMVDATGSDIAGRMTDHENDYVIKTDMTNRSGLSWYMGKLIRASYLNTMFYRDKQDTPLLDANRDGRPHGMDALLMTQVNKVNNANGWAAITEEDHGHVTAAMINERIAALNTEVESWAGQAGSGNARTKLSMMHVAFKDQHGVSPADLAWGSGKGNNPFAAPVSQSGCLDCHSDQALFYNGSVNTVGDNVEIYWDDDVVPFTKVNGFSQPTDMHPNVKDKFGKRSLAHRVTSGTGMFDDDNDPGTPDVQYNTVTEFPRTATMYEASFMTPAGYVTTATSSEDIGFGGFEKGWLLMVQVRDADTDDDPSNGLQPGTVITRTKAVGVGGGATDVASGAELITSLGTFATAFEFTITSSGNRITITADPGYEFKLAGGIDSSGAFKLSHAAYQSTTWNAVAETAYEALNPAFDGDFSGRTEWVEYLNAIGTMPVESFGINVDPVAAISSINGGNPVVAGTAVDLIADTGVNSQGYFTYSWTFNDGSYDDPVGSTVSKTFAAPGTYLVGLKVIDEEGKLDQVAQYVTVVAPAPAADITSTDNGIDNAQTVSFNNLPATYTRLYISWGDGYRANVYPTGSPDPYTMDHTFRKLSRYYNSSTGMYEYNAAAYVYNGSSRVDILRSKISISP